MRKVTLACSVILKLKEIAHIAVYYINLPKDRPFSFISSHPAAINTILNSKVPKIMVLHNPNSKPIKINKRIRLGTIHDYKDTAYFIANFDGVIKALVIASAIG